MNIFINDVQAEITLDTEKTLGDVMSGIEQWISPTGNRIKKIYTNGKEISGDFLSEAFCMHIEDIEKLDIYVSAWRELAAEALRILHETCIFYGNASYDERMSIQTDWKDSPGARFLSSDIPDIYNLAEKVLDGDGLSVADFASIIDERLRELADPWQETFDSEAIVKIISKRMEDFPLDMQTGKDQRAAETIQLFSQISGKLFRIFFIYQSEGLSVETFVIDDRPAKAFIEEFNFALRELSDAYENRDTVLAGDIAEYELAPRLLKFFTAMRNMTKSFSQV
jgi:hypothetical protein